MNKYIAAVLLISACSAEPTSNAHMSTDMQDVWYIPFECYTPDSQECNTARDSLTRTQLHSNGPRITTYPGYSQWDAYQEYIILPIQNNRIDTLSWAIDSSNECPEEYCTYKVCITYPGPMRCKSTNQKVGTTGIFRDTPITDNQSIIFRIYLESTLHPYNTFFAIMSFTHDPVW